MQEMWDKMDAKARAPYEKVNARYSHAYMHRLIVELFIVELALFSNTFSHHYIVIIITNTSSSSSLTPSTVYSHTHPLTPSLSPPHPSLSLSPSLHPTDPLPLSLSLRPSPPHRQVVANMKEAARNPYFEATFTEAIRKPPADRR